MKKTTLQKEQEMLQQTALQHMAMDRAKYENDIAVLLRPWYSFRVFVKFKKAFYGKRGERKDSQHFYGLEHAVSYRQCLYGHAKNIVLNKKQGFDHCVEMAEEKFAGRFYSLRIYSRSVFPDGTFDQLHRLYDEKGNIIRQIPGEGGEAIELVDPVITEEDNRTLYFSIKNGMLTTLSEENFEELVNENLNSFK